MPASLILWPIYLLGVVIFVWARVRTTSKMSAIIWGILWPLYFMRYPAAIILLILIFIGSAASSVFRRQ